MGCNNSKTSSEEDWCRDSAPSYQDNSRDQISKDDEDQWLGEMRLQEERALWYSMTRNVEENAAKNSLRARKISQVSFVSVVVVSEQFNILNIALLIVFMFFLLICIYRHVFI